MVIGNDRPEDDREKPAGAGVWPYCTGFGATVTGPSIFFGNMKEGDWEMTSVVSLRNAAGLAATHGFLDSPFDDPLAVGVTGEFMLSNRDTMSVIEP